MEKRRGSKYSSIPGDPFFGSWLFDLLYSTLPNPPPGTNKCENKVAKTSKRVSLQLFLFMGFLACSERFETTGSCHFIGSNSVNLATSTKVPNITMSAIGSAVERVFIL